MKFNSIEILIFIVYFFSSFSLFWFMNSRYEIEYDENRIEIGKEIAKRFLGIIFEDSGGGGGGGGNNEDDESGNNCKQQQQQQATSNASDEKDSVNYSISEKDEFVLDVLNDDLLDQVRRKKTSNYRYSDI